VVTPAAQPSAIVDAAALSTDPYGYPLSVSSFNQGKKGSVTIQGTQMTYTFSHVVTGDLEITDSFSYTVTDGHGNSASSTVTVSFSVVSHN
jgi:hypothetical protein